MVSRDNLDELKRAVESQHGGTATHAQSVYVHERHENLTAWEGVVHVFDLASHPKAKRAYVLSSFGVGDNCQFSTFLHIEPVTGPREAVRAAVAQQKMAHEHDRGIA